MAATNTWPKTTLYPAYTLSLTPQGKCLCAHQNRRLSLLRRLDTVAAAGAMTVVTRGRQRHRSALCAPTVWRCNFCGLHGIAPYRIERRDNDCGRLQVQAYDGPFRVMNTKSSTA